MSQQQKFEDLAASMLREAKQHSGPRRDNLLSAADLATTVARAAKNPNAPEQHLDSIYDELTQYAKWPYGNALETATRYLALIKNHIN
ncbi:hypothetical protein [Saccharopolyspora taberi]|uniref:Uncharacterized protein n=1 Tax=Saccharopolyspora taberi TaxID=60895 RepID=A0ABN3V0R0_9PSEU